MYKRKVMKLASTVNLIQVFESDDAGHNIGEFHGMEIYDGSHIVNTISFTGAEITSEALRTVADEMDMNRLECTGVFKNS